MDRRTLISALISGVIAGIVAAVIVLAVIQARLDAVASDVREALNDVVPGEGFEGFDPP